MLQWFFQYAYYSCVSTKLCSKSVGYGENGKYMKEYFFLNLKKKKKNTFKDYNIICILGVLKNLQSFIRSLKTMQVSEMFISLFRVTQSLMCYEG